MGVEGRDRAKVLEAGALALSGQLGKTVQRFHGLTEASAIREAIAKALSASKLSPGLYYEVWRSW